MTAVKVTNLLVNSILFNFDSQQGSIAQYRRCDLHKSPPQLDISPLCVLHY